MKLKIVFLVISIFGLIGCGADSKTEQNDPAPTDDYAVYEMSLESESVGIDINTNIDVSILGDGNEIHIFSTSEIDELSLTGSNNLLYVYDSPSIRYLLIIGDDNLVFVGDSLEMHTTISGLGNTVQMLIDLHSSEEGVRVSMERNGRTFDSDDVDLPSI